MNSSNSNLKYLADRPVLYLMVIGFHHKKGCQVEYVYPNDSRIQSIASSSSSDSNDLYKLPKKWKHLPSLALPDGSHNYDTDYIYFHLEDDDEHTASSGESNPASLSRAKPTLFGVSCYRQINASELLHKDSDVTRNTLQKSVCVLARSPVYASLRLKLFSITTAYFEQKDFHRTEILASAFDSLLHSENLMACSQSLRLK